MKCKWAVCLAVVGLVTLGLVTPVVSEQKDAEVEEIRIDDEGVRLGNERYDVREGEHGQGRVRVIGEDMVRFGDDIIVEEDEVVDGNVVTIFGSIVVDGAVEGDVVAVAGGIMVGPTGEIDGDAVAVGGGVTKEKGAIIRGETVSIGTGPVVGPKCTLALGNIFSRTGRLFMFILWTILLVILGLIVTAVAKRPVDNVCMRARKEAFKMGLIGLLAEVLVLPVMALFIITIIGIPIGAVAIPLVFALALLLGFVGVSLAVGERAGGGAERSAYMSVTVGILMLQALVLLGWIVRLPGGAFSVVGNVIAFIGWAVIYVAGTVGLGGVIMSKFGTKALEVKAAEIKVGQGV